MTLREELRRSVKTREYLLSTGKSKRKDPEAVRRSMDKATVFLNSYPFASDERVGEWCRENLEDVCRIVTGNNDRRLGRLIQLELAKADPPKPQRRKLKAEQGAKVLCEAAGEINLQP